MPTVDPTPSVLMVSREQAAEARYGLSKSLRLLMAALEAQGVATAHFGFKDLDPFRLQQAQYRGDTLRQWLDELCDGVDDLSLLRQFFACVVLGQQAVQAARQGGLRQIHVHDAAIGLGVGLATLGRRDRPRWGITQHSFDCMTEAIHRYIRPLPWALRAALRRLERWVLQRADWVVFLSSASRSTCARQLGMAVPPHWHVIPHPLPSLTLPDRQAAREQLGWAEDETVILSIGQLVPLKGHPMLLQACASLADVARLRVVILGDGHLDHIEHSRSVAAALGIRCDLGPVADVSPYLAAADVYVSSSFTESYGLANVEAALAGLPMVCTAVGAVPEVLSGSGACLVAPGAVELAAGIRAALAGDRQATVAVRRAWQARQATAAAIATTCLGLYANDKTDRPAIPVPGSR